jgi:hypothetical protein
MKALDRLNIRIKMYELLCERCDLNDEQAFLMRAQATTLHREKEILSELLQLQKQLDRK